jgi:cytochrome c-type biogenesis protein CcmH/NrfF
VQSWIANSKPAILIRDHGRYLRLDPALRVAKLAEWNKPVYWPVVAIVALIAVLVAFTRRHLRRRERLNARGELLPA